MQAKKLICVSVLMGLSTAAFSETVDVTQEQLDLQKSALAKKLGDINNNIVLLEAQIKQSKLTNTLLKEQKGDSGPLSSMPTETEPEEKTSQVQPPPPVKEIDPVEQIVVNSIEGYAGDMSALVSYGGEGFFQVKEGAEITEKWSVKEIGASFIVLATKGKKPKLKRIAIGAVPPKQKNYLEEQFNSFNAGMMIQN